MNLPDSNFLSAPLWLITTLHWITLTLHFAAMNFLVGGLIVLLHGRFANRWENATVMRFVKSFPSAMAATVSLGVAPLLFVQLVYPRQIYSAAIVSGWFWLMIALAAIVSYYLLYGAAFSKAEAFRLKKRLLLGALLGFLYVSAVYSSVFSMAERPESVKQLYLSSQSGLVWNPMAGDYLWRWLHMITGAATVGGFFVGLLGRDDPEAFAVGKRFFLWGMIAASIAGLGYLFSLGSLIAPLMRTPAAWSLMIGILLSVASLHFFLKKRFLMTATALFASLLSMVINRHFVRLLKLGGQFDPTTWRVAPQWSPFVLFLVCFLVALALIWYMLRIFFADHEAANGES
jgi:hypothetical protein